MIIVGKILEIYLLVILQLYFLTISVPLKWDELNN